MTDATLHLHLRCRKVLAYSSSSLIVKEAENCCIYGTYLVPATRARTGIFPVSLQKKPWTILGSHGNAFSCDSPQIETGRSPLDQDEFLGEGNHEVGWSKGQVLW